jgi:hypothetical protein
VRFGTSALVLVNASEFVLFVISLISIQMLI